MFRDQAKPRHTPPRQRTKRWGDSTRAGDRLGTSPETGGCCLRLVAHGHGPGEGPDEAPETLTARPCGRVRHALTHTTPDGLAAAEPRGLPATSLQRLAPRPCHKPQPLVCLRTRFLPPLLRTATQVLSLGNGEVGGSRKPRSTWERWEDAEPERATPQAGDRGRRAVPDRQSGQPASGV